MSDEKPKLPQSLYDAIRKGEEEGQKSKKPLSPEFKAMLQRLREGGERIKNDPEARKAFRRSLQMLGEAMDERDQEIAQLNGQSQVFLVTKDFSHDTNERYIDSRHLTTPEKYSVRYISGATLYLRPVQFHAEYEDEEGLMPHMKGHVSSYWGWVDSQGWVIRDGILTGYLFNKKVLKENKS